MYFDSLFWVIVVVAFAALQLLPAGATRLRAGVLSLVGIAGLVLVLKLPPTGWAILAISGAALWLGCRRLAARKPGDATGLALLAIAPLLLAWVFGKIGTALDWPRPLLFVGLAYLVVKAWSLLKDIMDGKVRDIEPFEVAAYFLHLPTFVLGPMHYFGEFRATLRRPYALTGEAVVDIVFRFVLGLIKIYALAGLLAKASLLGVTGTEPLHLAPLIRKAFIYSFVLYFDFSGYCDMAIAVSRLLGVDVPENFNWPLLSTSIRDFWRRWHITFSRALTAHMFIPLTRVLQRRLPHAPNAVAVIGYFGTFLFCGYWHGATVNFLLWGLWHATGLAGQDLWIRYRRGKGFKPPMTKNAFQRTRDTALTFAFVSTGWILFVLPVSQLSRIGGW